MRLPFTLLHFATKNYLLAQANRAPLHFCICSVGYAAYKKAKNQVLKEANISIFTAATMFKQMNNITCSLCGRNMIFSLQQGGDKITPMSILDGWKCIGNAELSR